MADATVLNENPTEAAPEHSEQAEPVAAVAEEKTADVNAGDAGNDGDAEKKDDSTEPAKVEGDTSATHVYVAHLPYSFTRDDLNDLFKEFGEISESRILVEKWTNKSRGVGFVHFVDGANAKNAVEAINDKVLPNHEKPLLVKFANTKSTSRKGKGKGKGRRGGFRGGYSSRGGYGGRGPPRGYGYGRYDDDFYGGGRGGYDRGYDRGYGGYDDGYGRGGYGGYGDYDDGYGRGGGKGGYGPSKRARGGRSGPYEDTRTRGDYGSGPSNYGGAPETGAYYGGGY